MTKIMNDTIVVPDYIQELLLASSHDLHSFTRKLSLLLSCPVIVSDPLFHVQSFSVKDKTLNVVDINISRKETNYTEEPLFTCEISIGTDHSKCIGSAITINNKTLGYLFIMGGQLIKDLALYRPIISYAVSLCALHFERKLEIRHEKFKLKKVFLYDLLYGNMKQKEDIIDYGKLWNWDFTLPHVVTVFSITDYDYFITNKQWINPLLKHIENSLIQKNIIPITITKQNEVIAIIPFDNVNPVKFHSDLTKFASSVLNKAKCLDMEGQIACGIGKIYSNPADLFRSYQEAKVAFELGLLSNVEIPFFNHLGMERILYKHDLQDLKEFYDYTLGDLLKYDRENGTNLMETLEYLVSNEYNMSKTSQTLYLHRNTLRYRIKKIEEILNLNLESINVRLNISTAIKIKQIRKI